MDAGAHRMMCPGSYSKGDEAGIWFFQVIANGLMMGGVYVLVAVGLSMIFGVMKIVNFAQADMIMIGMYVTLIMWPVVGNSGVPYYLLPFLIVIMYVSASLFTN